MKKFLKKILIGTCICCVLPILYTVIFFELTNEEASKSYVAAIADKVELLSEIDEPKIIIIGNSNVAFGIDSELIEEAYDMPVVNMGLHGGLGNELIEELAKEYINEGDIVIIAHSSYSDDGKMQDFELAWPMIISSDYVKEIIFDMYFVDVIKTLPSYMLSTSISFLRGLEMYSDEYARDSFNEYGDVSYERSELTYEFTSDEVTFEISSYTTDRINEYNSYCESIGANLLVAGYPIAYGEYSTYTEEDIEIFQNELDEALDCQIISNYIDYQFDYEYFYNTSLHLNDAGSEIRTYQLIEDLTETIFNN